MTTSSILLFIFAVTMVLIYKTINKEIPILLKRKREEWEEENKNRKNNYTINNVNSNKGNLYNTINKSEQTYQNATEIATHFNISAIELNNIFQLLKWAYKENKWWIATKLGESKGARQEYDQKSKLKYIKWDTKIKNNFELINAIKTFKETEAIQTKSVDILKKEKGDKYEAYVAEHYRKQGYTVWEHGKEKGDKDGGIDLLVKKGKEALFVQCKDWENYKINDKIVKATQTDVRNYMLENPVLTSLLNECEKRIIYVTSRECLTKGAYTYIENKSHIIGYEVIPKPNN